MEAGAPHHTPHFHASIRSTLGCSSRRFDPQGTFAHTAEAGGGLCRAGPAAESRADAERALALNDAAPVAHIALGEVSPDSSSGTGRLCRLIWKIRKRSANPVLR